MLNNNYYNLLFFFTERMNDLGFNGFNKKDFDTFKIAGLEERMEAIRERIQPKFQAIGNEMVDHLSDKLGEEIYLHIAQHARRTVNAPKDTWSAYCHNKRGYKKHPHFQIGLFDDHVFVWLAFIYELPHKKEIAEVFLNHVDDIENAIPKDYVVSMDHMKKSASNINEMDLEESLERFKNVKKAEFLVGRHFDSTDPILKNGELFINEIKEIYDTLIPIYNLSFHIN